jgi:hypothetical protein
MLRSKTLLKAANQELIFRRGVRISSPGWRQMQDEAKTFGVDPKLANETFATGWLAVHVFAEVAGPDDNFSISCTGRDEQTDCSGF